eukprot:6447324-Prymnesium_polylepis.1
MSGGASPETVDSLRPSKEKVVDLDSLRPSKDSVDLRVSIIARCRPERCAQNRGAFMRRTHDTSRPKRTYPTTPHEPRASSKVVNSLSRFGLR